MNQPFRSFILHPLCRLPFFSQRISVPLFDLPRHSVRGGLHGGVPLPLGVVVHVLQQPLEHLPVAGAQQGEPQRQDHVEHGGRVPDARQHAALLAGVTGAAGAQREAAARTPGPSVTVRAADNAHVWRGRTWKRFEEFNGLRFEEFM